jgi:glycogen debranching enzyme
MIAKVSGPGHEISEYVISDREMPVGSTLGSPKCSLIIKSTGALEKIFSCEAGLDLFHTLVLHHWDRNSGIPLLPSPGEFVIHPDRQDHMFELANGVTLHEKIFMLNRTPSGSNGHRVAPPAAYYAVELRNDGEREIEMATYASIRIGSGYESTAHTAYDGRLHAFVAWNDEAPDVVRMVSCSRAPESYEVTDDNAKTNAAQFPGPLSNEAIDASKDPLGIFHLDHRLKPGECASFFFTLTFSLHGRDKVRSTLASLPEAREALDETRRHYSRALGRAVIMTPEAQVNRGALWAKANMLRVQLLTEQGWCFVNDPTRSNNSVARDTSWYAFGGDYVVPYFTRDALRWYVDHLSDDGMVVEYFDIRDGKTETYGLTMNDNTPLLILALWHHYCVTGDREFLTQVFPQAQRAAKYILSQRGEHGLIWCCADGTGSQGIVGWRNVIQGYRLDGATTELNSECHAALQTMSKMANELGDERIAREFEDAAKALRAAINEHLLDRSRNVYYLTIDWDGKKRTDLTSDLVFPVLFDVADHDVATNIIATLSRPEFWTDAGLHTVPRTAIDYGPAHGSGLLGGVWGGPTFWFAAAAAAFNAEFMANALISSFKHYAQDPRRYNTVPGQFSEWLHGETLTNHGMMLSPWFAPKYLWAAMEGAAGLEVTSNPPKLHRRLPAGWSWMGARNVMVRGRDLAWFTVRLDKLTTYANSQGIAIDADHQYDEDVSDDVRVGGDHAMSIALRRDGAIAILVGNTFDRTISTSLSIPKKHLPQRCDLRLYDSLVGEWHDIPDVDVSRLRDGFPVQVARHGFSILEVCEKKS